MFWSVAYSCENVDHVLLKRMTKTSLCFIQISKTEEFSGTNGIMNVQLALFLIFKMLHFKFKQLYALYIKWDPNTILDAQVGGGGGEGLTTNHCVVCSTLLLI